jgi:predicted ATPase
MEVVDTAAVAEESNNNSLLPIREWIHLSKLAEQQQVSSGNNNGGESSSSSATVENHRKSQLDYITRSTIVATLILERLLPPDGSTANGNNGGGEDGSNNNDMVCAIHRTQDISIDNIHLDLDCDNDVDLLKQQLNNNNCHEDLISKLQSVRGVKISLHESGEQSIDDGDNNGSADKQSTTTATTTSTEIFQRIGYILYILFARGEEPPSSSSPTTASESSAEDVMSNARRRMRSRGGDGDDDNDDDDELDNNKNNNDAYEEHAGANKGRQKLSLHETTKTFRRLNILSDIVEDILSGKYGVPNSICRLISDLIVPPEDMDDRFHSIMEVLDELQQIVKRPDVYLSNGENGTTTTTRSFQFNEGIVGRQHEIGMLLEASARTQINNDTSHICLIGGMAGVGKSYLVTSVKDVLTSHGWIYLSCKFDRLMRNQPLATIASTMEYFIQQLILQRGEGGGGGGGGPSTFFPNEFDANAVITTIERRLGASGIVVLSDLVPGLRVLYPDVFARVIIDDDDSDSEVDGGGGVSDIDSSSDDKDVAQNNSGDDNGDETMMDEDGISSANTLRNRLHYLFGKLVGSISSVEHPILLFLDDIQWADLSSLELLSSLLTSGDHDDDNTQCLLVTGSFRSNEVDQDHILSHYLQMFTESRSVNVTNIQLDGMAKSATHIMITEALLLPLRLTRGLADVVHAKSLGNPLFVQSFLRRLVDEKILHYSLTKKRWVWDIRNVKSVSVDENVADLMKHKLLRLPDEIQDALKLISCFGTQVSTDIVRKLTSSSNNLGDVITHLDQASEESILEHNDQVYKFAHDMLQQATYELMSPDQRGAYHFSIGLQLMPSISNEGSFDSLIFTVVDQINNAKSYGVTDDSMNISFAKMNLQAGKRSMEVSDFVSALQYVVFGISFLPDAKWASSTYELSLDLHEAAALACFVNVDNVYLERYLEAIFENAARFEDKIKAYYIMAQNLASLGRLKEAMSTVFFVLSELDEEVPDSVSAADVQRTMLSTKQMLDGYSKEDIVSLPRLKDEKKQWAVKLMSFITPSAFMASPRHLPILANRIINILLTQGSCKEAAFGLSNYSLCAISILHDIEAGYGYGKMSIALLESFNPKDSLIPRMKCLLQNMVNYLVEPIQSTASVLLQNYEELRSTGDNSHAALAMHQYSQQMIMSGSFLPTLEKQIGEFALRSLRLQQLTHCRSILSEHIVVLALTGNAEAKNPFDILVDNRIGTLDDLLQEALSSGHSGLAQSIYCKRMFVAFWLKQYTEAGELANLYRSQERATASSRFLDIFHTFYEGLTAFHLAYNTTDPDNKIKWMGIGERSIDRFKVWQKHSSWNFENKLLLLQAEYHRCQGEDEDAKIKFEAAIESAKLHRFVHEEGLAMELYSSFLKKKGDLDNSKKQLLLAIDCYERWGASAIVELVKSESVEAERML